MRKEKSIKDFIEWTKFKIRIHFLESKAEFYFKNREIWWASLGINIAYEEDGKGKYKGWNKNPSLFLKFTINCIISL